MKVALVTCWDKGNGIGNYSDSLSKELMKIDKDFCKILIKTPKGKISQFLAPLIIARKIKKTKFDLYHADFIDSAFGLFLAKKDFITTIHDDIPYKYPQDRNIFWIFFYKLVFNLIKKKSKKIITISNFSKKDLVSHNIKKDKIKVIPNGVDLDKFYKENRTKNKKIKIGYLSGLGTRKRVDKLVKAFHILYKKNKNIELHVGGSGKERLNLIEIINKNNIKNVFFMGFISDKNLRNFYNSLDVFVFPSDYEGFGLSILEAMACGVPVVVVRKSCLPEVVGEAGVITKPDIKSISKGIEKVINDNKLRKLLIKKGLRKVRDFQWNKISKKYKEIYREVGK